METTNEMTQIIVITKPVRCLVTRALSGKNMAKNRFAHIAHCVRTEDVRHVTAIYS